MEGGFNEDLGIAYGNIVSYSPENSAYFLEKCWLDAEMEAFEMVPLKRGLSFSSGGVCIFFHKDRGYQVV